MERADSGGIGRLGKDTALAPGVPPDASEAAEPAHDSLQLDITQPLYRSEGLRLLWDFLQDDPDDDTNGD